MALLSDDEMAGGEKTCTQDMQIGAIPQMDSSSNPLG
jgi:hypothetical protein